MTNTCQWQPGSWFALTTPHACGLFSPQFAPKTILTIVDTYTQPGQQAALLGLLLTSYPNLDGLPDFALWIRESSTSRLLTRGAVAVAYRDSQDHAETVESDGTMPTTWNEKILDDVTHLTVTSDPTRSAPQGGDNDVWLPTNGPVCLAQVIRCPVADMATTHATSSEGNGTGTSDSEFGNKKDAASPNTEKSAPTDHFGTNVAPAKPKDTEESKSKADASAESLPSGEHLEVSDKASDPTSGTDPTSVTDSTSCTDATEANDAAASSVPQQTNPDESLDGHTSSGTGEAEGIDQHQGGHDENSDGESLAEQNLIKSYTAGEPADSQSSMANAIGTADSSPVTSIAASGSSPTAVETVEPESAVQQGPTHMPGGLDSTQDGLIQGYTASTNTNVEDEHTSHTVARVEENGPLHLPPGAFPPAQNQAPAEPMPGPVSPSATTPPQILAVACPAGHENSTTATQCRVCGAPVHGIPRLVPVPSKGTLQVSVGSEIPLSPQDSVIELVSRDTIFGRSPSSQTMTEAQALGGNAAHDTVRLVRIPHREISSTHARFHLDEWQVSVIDCNSTNGTFLERPGKPRQRLPGGTLIPLRTGDVVNFNHGITVTVREVA